MPTLDMYEALNLPDRARTSCRDLQEHAVTLDLPAYMNPTAAERFVTSFQNQVDEIRTIGSSLANTANATRMEGTFTSIQQEAGTILLMHALDFGGGWRQELHQFHQKGAFATVKPGVEHLFSTQPNLHATWLAQISHSEIGDLFGLSKSNALAPFVSLLVNVCHELGHGVVAAGYQTLGAFVERKVDSANKTDAPAAALVKDLVDTFPYTFNDVHEISGRPVMFYKKAQLVVGELGHRFRNEDQRFNFKDLSMLTAFIDNVIVAVLRKHAVVATTAELANKIDTHTPLPSGSIEEVSLRAAAMVGVETIAMKLGLDPCEVGNYLWGHLGKRPDHRNYQRHATKDTVFY